MIDLNNPIWKTVHGASGHVDQQLRRLLAGEGDFRENMDVLAENLSHQLSWYDATSYVLPHLARLCERLSVEDKLYLIAQIGPAIAAESQVSLSPDTEAYREFQEGLAPLAQETRELLEHHMDLVMNISDRIYVLDFGSLIAQGLPSEIQSNQHVIDAYLGVVEDE